MAATYGGHKSCLRLLIAAGVDLQHQAEVGKRMRKSVCVCDCEWRRGDRRAGWAVGWARRISDLSLVSSYFYRFFRFHCDDL